MPCEHAELAMEITATGYLTGLYYCAVCGQAVARP